MSGPGIEPQSWGGKTLAVVEISTDYPKKKSSFVIAIAEETIRGHQSWKSKAMMWGPSIYLERTLEETLKQEVRPQGWNGSGELPLNWHASFFSWSGQGHWVVEGSYRETNSKEASTKGEDDWCWRLKSETEAREWGERGMSNGTRRMGLLQVKNS